ncbi:MAG TPA: 3-methyl-2-oxobutanoate hydroxymethyltransferase, partial [Planctomycetaceae bacterium]
MGLLDLQRKKARGEPIVMVTAYDYPTGVLADRAGVDMVLVGDSLGMVALGYESTVPVTMEEMIHHTRAVVRGCRRPFVVADLPFMSYQEGPTQAVRNAGRLVKEGGADAVKMEGGKETVAAVSALAAAGIPVMSHLGLTPQTATSLGGYRVQGREATAARRLIDDAIALEEAGAFSILVECIPDRVAAALRERLRVPLIGIGAGPDCDGQVLVLSDMLGLFDRFVPRFAKQYANVSQVILDAIRTYA